MTTEEQQYENKELARLSMIEAIHSYYLAADEYGCYTYDIVNEISDAVFNGTDKNVRIALV